MPFDALDLRNAQGYYLGSQRNTAASTVKTGIVATLQLPSLLQDLIIVSDQLFSVDRIRVAGQNLIVSDEPVGGSLFAFDGQFEGHRSMGIPLDANQQVSIDATLVANGEISYGIGTDPLEAHMVVPVNDMGSALDYVGGLSLATPAAGASAFMVSTIRRPCDLGRLVLQTAATPDELEVRSITINNIEMLSGGPSGAPMSVPFSALLAQATDVDGLTLAYPAAVNNTMSVEIFNNSGGGLLCRGGYYILPGLAY